MSSAQKKFRGLYIAGIITLILPLLLTWVTQFTWVKSWLGAEAAAIILIGLFCIGTLLLLISFVGASVKAAPNGKSRFWLGFVEILVIVIVPSLVYFSINPIANSSSINQKEFVNDLLVVSTVLLGFTITIGGLKSSRKDDEQIDEADRQFLSFAKLSLIVSLATGFYTIFWILRWMIIGGDMLLNYVVSFFSGQISLMFLSSLAYLFLNNLSQKHKE